MQEKLLLYASDILSVGPHLWDMQKITHGQEGRRR